MLDKLHSQLEAQIRHWKNFMYDRERSDDFYYTNRGKTGREHDLIHLRELERQLRALER